MSTYTKTSDKEKRAGRPFVTISYEVGAYGMSVVDGLCKYLQECSSRTGPIWNVFDKNLAMEAMQDFNLPRSVLPYFSESTASEIEDFIESALSLHPAKSTLVYEINRTILRLAELGHVIIVGRGGNIVTAKLTGGVHVRLIGSFENRVRYFKEHFKTLEKEAKEFVAEESKRRGKYFKKYFGRDINDPLLYDLVFNTDRLSIKDIVEIIGYLTVKGKTISGQ